MTKVAERVEQEAKREVADVSKDVAMTKDEKKKIQEKLQEMKKKEEDEKRIERRRERKEMVEKARERYYLRSGMVKPDADV